MLIVVQFPSEISIGNFLTEVSWVEVFMHIEYAFLFHILVWIKNIYNNKISISEVILVIE